MTCEEFRAWVVVEGRQATMAEVDAAANHLEHCRECDDFGMRRFTELAEKTTREEMIDQLVGAVLFVGQMQNDPELR